MARGSNQVARAGRSLGGSASALTHVPKREAPADAERIGHWKVLSREPGKGDNARWSLKCELCGHRQSLIRTSLRYGAARCKGCGARLDTELPEPKSSPRQVVPVDPDERPVTTLTLRCSSCQSFGGFVSGRCNHCGSARVDYLEHVDGRRSA